MKAVWNDRNNRLNSKNGNETETFEAHVQRMRIFRKSHTCFEAKTLRQNNQMFLESLRNLYVTFITKETGGTRGEIGPEDWPALIPLWKVALLGCMEN